MDFIQSFLDFFLHLDVHLQEIIAQYGTLTYIILFLIIFAETGLVITPFLPGDSLLFAAGALAATGAFHVSFLFLLLVVAAFLGDTVNYWIGKFIGPKISKKKNRFIKKEHLDKTHVFFDKYGGKTIIIARFIPIIRTFAPFVSGIGEMHYPRFLVYNIVGGVLWVGIFIFGGYFFGNLPFVKNNFSIVIVAIIIFSLFPAVFEVVRQKLKKNPS